MKKITTSSGFECEFDEDTADDYELLESIETMTKGGLEAALAIPRFVSAVAGPENYARLKEHCRGENGRVSTQKITAEVQEMMALVSDDKKK